MPHHLIRSDDLRQRRARVALAAGFRPLCRAATSAPAWRTANPTTEISTSSGYSFLSQPAPRLGNLSLNPLSLRSNQSGKLRI